MNPSSIRRFVFTLITGYLAIFSVQRLPYEIDNQWAVLVPVLVVVYVITVWLDGVFFKEQKPVIAESAQTSKAKTKPKKPSEKGFG